VSGFECVVVDRDDPDVMARSPIPSVSPFASVRIRSCEG
jgi:hypothetical protein